MSGKLLGCSTVCLLFSVYSNDFAAGLMIVLVRRIFLPYGVRL
jgi:hypothetical protein